MADLNDKLVQAIMHYQQSLEKYAKRRNEEKILYYIKKLNNLPITVKHLIDTGVGRTVNSMRKIDGEVAKTADNLVYKWKLLVHENKEEDNEKEEPDTDESEEDTNSSHLSDSTKRKDFNSTHKDDQSTTKTKSTKDLKIKHEKKHKEENHHQNREKPEENKHHNREIESNSKQREEKSSKDKKHSKHSHKDESDKSERSSSSKNKTSKKHSPEDRKDKKEKEVKSKRKHEEEDERDQKRSKRTEEKSKEKKKHSKSLRSENGIDSGSGASFAEALGMLKPKPSSSKTPVKKPQISPPKRSSPMEADSPPDSPQSPQNLQVPKLLKAKALEPLDVDMSSLLPEITPNYRPLGSSLMESGFPRKVFNEDQTLSAVLSSRTQRTKVYSGNKTLTAVPTLEDLCLRTIKDNIHAMEYTGGVPYNILKPVLEHLTANQLFYLEHYNPYLIEETDELWCYHCQREFKSKQKQEMETWREMYLRCVDEREAKLRALTANIKQSQDKSLPVRQTKLAYVDSIVKPPRSIARKQAKHGTAASSSSASGAEKRPMVTPSSRLTALATAGAAGQTAVPNPAKGSSSNASTQNKPKKAPLMQKTLAFFKNNRRFRR